MITRQQIDEVLARTDLVALMGSRVDLKSAGNHRMKGCCPFHSEKTPSFVVYTDKQDYHCFGCGAHGNVIDWVMHRDGLRYWDAIRQLARETGVTLVEQKDKEQQDTDPALVLLKASTDWFQENLFHHPQAPQARDYLAKRGVSAEMQQAFCLGYAPPGWDNLVKRLKSDPEQLELAHGLGLLKRKEEQDQARSDGSTAQSEKRKGYDAFRDRLIFPIHNRVGEVVGFGGRSLHQDQVPKYLNSSDSPVFTKGHLLYGEYQAKKAGRVRQWLLVEGYMDVIAMHQHGLTGAVACLGTSITQQQIAALVRRGGEVCFVFDGDTAGRKAAVRAMQLCRELIVPGIDFTFLLLPDGEDPDSLLKARGAQAMREQLTNNSQRWSDFFLTWLFTQADSYSIEGKTKLIAMAEKELNNLPNRDFRTLLMRHIKDKIGLGQRRFGKSSGRQSNMPRLTSTRADRHKRRETGLLKLLAACIHSPDAWAEMRVGLLPQLTGFSPPLSSDLLKCLELVGSEGKDESTLAVHLAGTLSQPQREALNHYSNALESPHTPAQLENLARAILHECWQTAKPDQRRQLVDFFSSRRAKKTDNVAQSGGVF